MTTDERHAQVQLTRAQLSMLVDALARDTPQDDAAANRLLLMLHDARRHLDAAGIADFIRAHEDGGTT